MNRNWIRALTWLMCLALMLGAAAPAFAEQMQIKGVSPDESASLGTAVPVVDAPAAPRDSFLDNAAITEMVEEFLAKKNVPADRVGIGYCYTATGDEWFMNPDAWFYPGSMYKVPLMMILSERIRSGEVAPDTQIGGLDLDTVFEYILVYSNNDYAHKVRTFLGGDESWREEAKQYARLDSYDERYMLYCYFSPRYMTQVLETLYKAPERFPGVTDKLLKAEQAHYFRLPDEMHPYDIAQKYGSYLDNEGTDWNHTAGIVYTEHPFVLTVMTKNVGGHEALIGELAALFKNYTLGVDAQYAAYQQEQQAQEAARLAAEQAAQAAAAETPKPQQSSLFSRSTPTPVTQQAPQNESERRAHAIALSDRARRAGIIVLEILLVAAVAGGIAAVIIVKEKERKRYESYRRRFEAEMRQEALERERARQAQQARQRRRDRARRNRRRRHALPRRSRRRAPRAPLSRYSRPAAARPHSR